MLLFYFMGWNMFLGGVLCLGVIMLLSYVFGRSGILGKV